MIISKKWHCSCIFSLMDFRLGPGISAGPLLLAGKGLQATRKDNNCGSFPTIFLRKMTQFGSGKSKVCTCFHLTS